MSKLLTLLLTNFSLSLSLSLLPPRRQPSDLCHLTVAASLMERSMRQARRLAAMFSSYYWLGSSRKRPKKQPYTYQDKCKPLELRALI
jgi:hypothetical protein